MNKRIYPDFLAQTLGASCKHACDAKGGGKGGTPNIPAAPPTPAKAVTPKPVTEAATSARQEQRDKAAKASGIKGSILTSPLESGNTTGPGGKTLLGQ